MNKTKKRMAIAAIAAIGCLAGIHGFQNSEKESKSALTIANIEALTSGESDFANCKDGCSTDNKGRYCCTLFEKRLFFPKEN